MMDVAIALTQQVLQQSRKDVLREEELTGISNIGELRCRPSVLVRRPSSRPQVCSSHASSTHARPSWSTSLPHGSWQARHGKTTRRGSGRHPSRRRTEPQIKRVLPTSLGVLGPPGFHVQACLQCQWTSSIHCPAPLKGFGILELRALGAAFG